MNYQSFLIGPHLIGLLFIVIGLLQRYMPPKNINRWYGYRTLTARTNQKMWDEANRYSAIFMIQAGAYVLIIGGLAHAAALIFIKDVRMQEWLDYLILFGGAMGIGIMSTTVTEKHLAKTFKIKPAAAKKKK